MRRIAPPSPFQREILRRRSARSTGAFRCARLAHRRAWSDGRRAFGRRTHLASDSVEAKKKEGRLRIDESERVWRLTRLYLRAADVLGGAEQAEAWFKEPNYALGEETPLRFADTAPGAPRVEQLLGQIEHGIAA